MPDYSGQSTGRYHIIKKLGSGGMAVIYKAYDTNLDIDVAIKFIRTERLAPENAEKARRRFKIEAQKTAQLMHPNIVPVIDYGDFEGVPYLVMHLIEGGNTIKTILGAPIPWQDAVKLVLPIAHALEFAHEHHIVHRDVKPSNILLTRENVPLLSDFGIAKIIESEETMDGSTTGNIAIGTPEYMAPEQWEGKPLDGRADIYALGVVLYEMITGRPPFKADTVPATMVQVLRDPLPRPKQFIPNLPDSIEKILYKALARNPENRFKTMDEFAAMLTKISGTSNPSEENYLPIKKRIGKVLGFSVSVIGLMILLIGIINGWFKSGIIDTPTATSSIQVDPSSTPTNTQIPPTTEKSYTPDSMMLLEKDGMTLVYIPAGEFLMGSPEGEGNNDEHPQHSVYLDAFWMDRTEVSNEMYQKCVSAGVCSVPASKSSYTYSDYFNDPTYGAYPVISINWSQAKTYCEWAGRRLPTEAEWEKAAKGTDGNFYPWGNDFTCKSGNFDTESKFDDYTVSNNSMICDLFDDTSPVGSFSEGASPYGVLDMAGNVWEWTSDWYGKYFQENNYNPVGPISGDVRVLRGGSWNSGSFDLRSSKRISYNPLFTTSDFGFRCAKEAE